MVQLGGIEPPTSGSTDAVRPESLRQFSSRQHRAVYWQPSESDARGGIDRVSQRRGPGRHSGFADAAWRFTALDHMHIDGGRLIDAQHAIVVEVGLLHAAILDGDLAVQRR